jgi:hypothetical protein
MNLSTLSRQRILATYVTQIFPSYTLVYISTHSEDDSMQAEAYVLLIKSIAKPTNAPGCAFCSWKNPAAQPFLTPHGHTETTCMAKMIQRRLTLS